MRMGVSVERKQGANGKEESSGELCTQMLHRLARPGICSKRRAWVGVKLKQNCTGSGMPAPPSAPPAQRATPPQRAGTSRPMAHLCDRGVQVHLILALALLVAPEAPALSGVVHIALAAVGRCMAVEQGSLALGCCQGRPASFQALTRHFPTPAATGA